MMKKTLVVMLMLISVLTACSSTVTNLTEVKAVPKFVQDSVQPNVQLQLKVENKNSYYITLQSEGDTDFHYNVKGNIVEIHFDVSNSDTGTKQQNVYHLTTDKDIDVIEVYINGERNGFDIISSS